jgi:hypothetical protein
LHQVIAEKKDVADTLNLISSQADIQKEKDEMDLKDLHTKNTKLEEEIRLIKEIHEKVHLRYYYFIYNRIFKYF